MQPLFRPPFTASRRCVEVEADEISLRGFRARRWKAFRRYRLATLAHMLGRFNSRCATGERNQFGSLPQWKFSFVQPTAVLIGMSSLSRARSAKQLHNGCRIKSLRLTHIVLHFNCYIITAGSSSNLLSDYFTEAFSI